MNLESKLAVYDSIAADLRIVPEQSYVQIAVRYFVSVNTVVSIAKHAGVVRKVGRKCKPLPPTPITPAEPNSAREA